MRYIESAGGDFEGDSSHEEMPSVKARAMADEAAHKIGLQVIEFGIFFGKAKSKMPPTVSVRVVVYKKENLGTEDCSRLHKALAPMLEEAFLGRSLNMEITTPGINRVVKEGREFSNYIGKGILVWRKDTSSWSGGILEEACEEGITIKEKGERIRLEFEIIAKAKLDPSLRGTH